MGLNRPDCWLGMSIAALCLVLLAACIHAGWNIVAKTVQGDVRFALLTTLMGLVFWAPLGVPLSWTAGQGFEGQHWIWICSSAVLHVVYYLTLLRGYRHADLTLVYPLARGSGPLITACVATVGLGEHLGWQGWLGVLGIVGGIILMTSGRTLAQSLRQGWSRRMGGAVERSGRLANDGVQARKAAGIFYGLLTGAFIAAYSVLDAYAVKYGGLSPIVLDYMGNAVRVPVLWAVWAFMHRTVQAPGLPLARDWAQQWRPALWIGAVSPIAYVLVLYAVQLAPLSHVAPAREVSMLVAALVGGHLLGESADRSWRLLGAFTMTLGVMWLARS